MNLVRMQKFNRISKDEIFSQQFRGRGILQATCLRHAYQPAPFLYLLMKNPGAYNFPSWMSRVRIPSPAFFGKLLGFNIIQREPFSLLAVTGFTGWSQPTQLYSMPVAVSFSLAILCMLGRFGLLRSPPQPTCWTGPRLVFLSIFLISLTWRCCLFVSGIWIRTLTGTPKWYLDTYAYGLTAFFFIRGHINWLVTAVGVSPPAPQPCRPIFFVLTLVRVSISVRNAALFQSVVGT